jgi:hypothetical protein
MRPIVLALFAAVVLTAASPSVLAQCQRAKLLSSTAQQGDEFGWSVAISGDTAIVGCYLDDQAASQAGAAFIYERTPSGWMEVQKLMAGDAAPSDLFGSAVAISGDTVAVTAPNKKVGNLTQAGAAYIFVRGASGWVESAKVVSNDPSWLGGFGNYVTLWQGDRLLVAKYFDGQVASYSGAVYVFDRQGTSWAQTAKLKASDAKESDNFGQSVSVAGDRVLIGAAFVDVASVKDAGAAYLFELTPSGWTETQKLTASDGGMDDRFGWSVVLSGTTALVGSILQDAAGQNAGAVYVFGQEVSGWIQKQKLVSSNSGSGAKFGISVAIAGDLAIVGAETDGPIDAGAAYAFKRSGSNWSQIGKLLAKKSSQSDLMGRSVGISGATAIVSAHTDDNACPSNLNCNSGAAYVFELAPTAAQYGSCATGAPCGNADDHGGCANSTGEGAILGACGSGSVTTDDLAFELTHLPPFAFGLVYMGPAQTQAPFGDGLRCVGPGALGFFRFPVMQADGSGSFMLGPGLVAASASLPPGGQIQPGSTWNFQCWYRDPNGPCGSGFNLSNGVSVLFEP